MAACSLSVPTTRRTVTGKGSVRAAHLAELLRSAMGVNESMFRLCALICRHARTFKRLYDEEECCGLLPSQLERWDQSERLIRRYVTDLPWVGGKAVRPRFLKEGRIALVLATGAIISVPE